MGLRNDFTDIQTYVQSRKQIRARRHLLGLWDKLGMVGVFLVLFLVLAATVPNFLSLVNLKGLATTRSNHQQGSRNRVGVAVGPDRDG